MTKDGPYTPQLNDSPIRTTMPAPMLSTSPVFPALYLYPLDDSFFIPKQINLASSGRRIQLGRKTSKSPPLHKNQVYFDSSVVSRRHAEVWQEGNKVRSPLFHGSSL